MTNSLSIEMISPNHSGRSERNSSATALATISDRFGWDQRFWRGGRCVPSPQPSTYALLVSQPHRIRFERCPQATDGFLGKTLAVKRSLKRWQPSESVQECRELPLRKLHPLEGQTPLQSLVGLVTSSEHRTLTKLTISR